MKRPSKFLQLPEPPFSQCRCIGLAEHIITSQISFHQDLEASFEIGKCGIDDDIDQEQDAESIQNDQVREHENDNGDEKDPQIVNQAP